MVMVSPEEEVVKEMEVVEEATSRRREVMEVERWMFEGVIEPVRAREIEEEEVGAV